VQVPQEGKTLAGRNRLQQAFITEVTLAAGVAGLLGYFQVAPQGAYELIVGVFVCVASAVIGQTTVFGIAMGPRILSADEQPDIRFEESCAVGTAFFAPVVCAVLLWAWYFVMAVPEGAPYRVLLAVTGLAALLFQGIVGLCFGLLWRGTPKELMPRAVKVCGPSATAVLAGVTTLCLWGEISGSAPWKQTDAVLAWVVGLLTLFGSGGTVYLFRRMRGLGR
jgi:hypothetical protein